MSGFFSSNNIDVQRTDNGWTFTKSGRKGKSTVYQVTDTNGNGRYDKGDVAKLIKSELGLFSSRDMNNAVRGVYETEGNEYSFDEMYGLAAIEDQGGYGSEFSSYRGNTSYSFSMGSYMNPYGGFHSYWNATPLGRYYNMGYNNHNYWGPGNYMQIQSYTPATQNNAPVSNPYAQLQDLAEKQTEELNNPNSENNIKKHIYEQIQDEINNVDEDGCNNELTAGNHNRLKEIIAKVDENYQNLTDDMVNESAEIINAGAVSTKMIEKMEEVYVDTAEDQKQRDKSQNAINNLVEKINDTLDKYCSASDADKKKILSDYNYAELTAILIEFDQGDVEKMDTETIKKFTEKVIKIMNSGPKDITEE